MPSEYVAVGTRLLSRPAASPATGPAAGLSTAPGGWPEAEAAHPWDERVPPPGRDATLLAVVPIPGTGTSLAIVGYAIATSDRPDPATAVTVVAAKPAGQATQAARTWRTGPAAEPEPQPAGTGLFLDHVQRRVWADGREITLTFQEFELLAFLSARPAVVFSRADLIRHVWHRDAATDTRAIARDSRTVDVHVSRVRRKLGLVYGQCLVTEYRVGYQFRPLDALIRN